FFVQPELHPINLEHSHLRPRTLQLPSTKIKSLLCKPSPPPLLRHPSILLAWNSPFGWGLQFPTTIAAAVDMLDEMPCRTYPQHKVACWAWRI
ncbi:unnamed protein product, partial [Urochloa humidicola]